MKPFHVSPLVALAFLSLSLLSANGQGSASSYTRRLGPLVNNPNRSPNPGPRPAAPAQQAPPPRLANPAPAGPPGVPIRPTLSSDEVERKRLEWQIERAEKGSPSAQYDLGMRYLKGDGVELNEELGRSWLEKAAKQGDNLAYQKLKNTDYSVEQRDDTGRIIHSKTARQEFMKQTGHPSGRPGYVIMHIKPVAEGGSDSPGNMQWQTIEDARARESAK